MTELICVNTLCKSDDPETRCGCCGEKIAELGTSFKVQPYRRGYCTRCGNKLVLFDKELITRAAIKAMDIPQGQVFDIADCFENQEN